MPTSKTSSSKRMFVLLLIFSLTLTLAYIVIYRTGATPSDILALPIFNKFSKQNQDLQTNESSSISNQSKNELPQNASVNLKSMKPDNSTSSITPKRSPFPLVPDQGSMGTFNINQSSKMEPKFINATIDPLNAKIGNEITIIVTLTKSSDIQSITGKVDTDVTPISFKFSKLSSQDKTETWQAKYKLDQPFDYKYVYHFVAKTSSSTNQLDMALRN